jgi:hypothetical protein
MEIAGMPFKKNQRKTNKEKPKLFLRGKIEERREERKPIAGG